MSFISRFRITDERMKSEAVARLVQSSTPDFDFFLFVVLAVLMATIGLLLNSATVIIGSMLIAPILSPVLSLALGLVMSDHQLLYRSFSTLLKALVLAFGLSFVAALFFVPENMLLGQEILTRAAPSLMYFAVAVISGLAVSYALVHPELNETLPGIAISVALLPPVAVVGIGLRIFEWEIISGALLLLLINIAGIVFASMVSFSLMDLYRKKKVAEKAIEREDERLEDEQKKIEELEQETAS